MSIFSSRFGRSSRERRKAERESSRRAGRFQSLMPAVEALENRQLLAVTASVSGTAVSLLGDAANDDLLQCINLVVFLVRKRQNHAAVIF